MIRIYITEDQEMYLEGLALLLHKQGNIQVTGTSKNGTDLLSQLPSTEIDILLLDVHLPDINEESLIKTIRELQPNLKIIYLTMMRGTRNVHKLLKHNIQGYILKNAPLKELLNAIAIVSGGGTYFTREVDIRRENDFLNDITLGEKNTEEILSKREIEILILVCKEYSNAQIAEKLFLSVSTVETHRKNLIARLGVNNTVGLVKYALRNNLIA